MENMDEATIDRVVAQAARQLDLPQVLIIETVASGERAELMVFGPFAGIADAELERTAWAQIQREQTALGKNLAGMELVMSIVPLEEPTCKHEPSN